MKKFPIFVVQIIFGLSAHAHDTWLIPDRFEVAPKTKVKFDLTSGMAFPALEVGPKPERVEAVKCKLGDRTFDIADISSGPKSLIFKTEFPEPGVVAVWVKVPARTIELKPAEVQEYLDEIAAPETIRKQWSEMTPKRWREVYTKHPKTFVRVGDAKDDQSWAKRVGLALEIIPEKDPTALHVGDELSFRVLKDGAPFPDFAVNALAAGETKGDTKRTDSEGRVAFRFAKPGQWLLRGTDVRKSSKPDTDWESDFATLTLGVKDR